MYAVYLAPSSWLILCVAWHIHVKRDIHLFSPASQKNMHRASCGSGLRMHQNYFFFLNSWGGSILCLLTSLACHPPFSNKTFFCNKSWLGPVTAIVVMLYTHTYHVLKGLAQYWNTTTQVHGYTPLFSSLVAHACSLYSGFHKSQRNSLMIDSNTI